MTALSGWLPRAVAWAEIAAAEICRQGVALNAAGRTLARQVGVLHPERIRVWVQPALPMPDDAELAEAARRHGFFGPGMIGLTLGYGIFLAQGQVASRLLAHEFRHVQQYEQAGSIAAFLTAYLEQIDRLGYDQAPLEQDARAHEHYGLTNRGGPWLQRYLN